MLRTLDQRQFLRFGDREDLAKRLKSSFKIAQDICKVYSQRSLNSFVPPSLMIPRITHYDLDKVFLKQVAANDVS